MICSAQRVVPIFVLLIAASLPAASAAADLFINVTPPTLTVAPGERGEVMIQSQPQPGFPDAAASIEYRLTGVRGIKAEALSVAAPAFAAAPLRISVDRGVAPGTYHPTIEAVLRDGRRAEMGDKPFPGVLTVKVAAVTSPGFSVTLPPAVELQAGTELELPISIRGENGWSGPVDVRISPPIGLTIDPEAFTVNAGDLRVVRVRVAADAPPKGVMTVQAQTTSGGQLVMKEARVQVNITRAGPVGDFVMEVDP